MKNLKVLITGSTFWNSGDDLVRHGVMNLIEDTVYAKYGSDWRVEFALHSFTIPGGNEHSPLKEDLNLMSYEDLFSAAKYADVIVVPGLACGEELKMFFRQVRIAKCNDKLVFVGGMNENRYCEKHAEELQLEHGTFSESRIVIGRTEKRPQVMDWSRKGYHCLPCPSIFGNKPTEDRAPTGPVLFSLQRPEGSHNAVDNHHTGIDAVLSCGRVMSEWIGRQGVSDTRIVAHHKSEREHVPVGGVPVEFYSEEEYLNRVYRRCRAVVSTRLHAVLRAESMGIPALLVNDTERHIHAMKQFPHIPITTDVAEIHEWLDTTSDLGITLERLEESCKFRQATSARYLEKIASVI